MKKFIMIIMIVSFALVELLLPVQATAERKKVKADEAITVATNWISLISQIKGHWAGCVSAVVKECREFRRGKRIIGYFCPVKPRGFIVVSSYKMLSPVKAYSTLSNLDPDSEEGLTDLIKGKMEKVLKAIEGQIGPIEAASITDVENVLKIDYRGDWEQLGVDAPLFKQDLASGAVTINYQGGKVLLSSVWDQSSPFRQGAPEPPPGDDCTENRCKPGCGPVAAGQVMRYWSWPTIDETINPYNWPDMPDVLIANESTSTQIEAVTKLLHDIGIEAGAKYCGGSTGPCATGTCFAGCIDEDILDTFEDHFWYSNEAERLYRSENIFINPPENWFNRMKEEFNKNRPIPYRVEKHIIVSDGWQEIGSTPIMQYHMNYGWEKEGDCQDGCNTWYTLDEIHLGGIFEEEMLVNIYPYTALGNWLSGSYGGLDNLYFDQNASGNSAFFPSGKKLQFLPGITVKGISSIGDSIRFEGSDSANTWLFTNGDLSQGIRIHGGALELMNNGGITLLPLGVPRYLSVSHSASDFIILNWEEGYGNQDGFEIERSVNAGCNKGYHNIGTCEPFQYLTTVPSTGYTDLGLDKYKFHCYRIRSMRNDGARSSASIEYCQETQPFLFINGAGVLEGDSGTYINAVFTVTLSEADIPPVVDIEVAYETEDGTAEAGIDYTANTGTLIFQPGDTTKEIVVEVIGDNIKEGDEWFFVKIKVTSGKANIYDNQGQGNIIDDD